MKSILYILTVGLLFSCGAGDGASIDASIVKNNYSAIEDYESVTGGPKMIFNETEYEFPPMIKGDELEHAFYFVNAGDAPLVLTNVKGSMWLQRMLNIQKTLFYQEKKDVFWRKLPQPIKQQGNSFVYL